MRSQLRAKTMNDRDYQAWLASFDAVLRASEPPVFDRTTCGTAINSYQRNQHGLYVPNDSAAVIKPGHNGGSK